MPAKVNNKTITFVDSTPKATMNTPATLQPSNKKNTSKTRKPAQKRKTTSSNDSNKKKKDDNTSPDKIVAALTSDPDDDNDGNELVVTLEKGHFEFKPKWTDFDQVEKERKKSVVDGWNIFALCARSIICDKLEIRGCSSVSHITLGCCNPSVFYLSLYDQQGAQFYQWFEDRPKNGVMERNECIQFRFKKELPLLDLRNNDWAEHEIHCTYQGGAFGEIVTKYRVSLSYISLTCNVNTGMVFGSFKYKKAIDTGDGFKQL